MATLPRAPRILWITRNCLVDHTSGASLDGREMLTQLVSRGYEIEILGATVFDAGEGTPEVRRRLQKVAKPTSLLRLPDGVLTHTLVKTASPKAEEMRLCEIDKLFSLYLDRLDRWQPDLVWIYGGRSLDLLVLAEAKRRKISTAFYLVNGSYTGSRWYEDIDLILTDSQATAKFYRRRLGVDVRPIGKFIPKDSFRAVSHERRHVTFINPRPAKGAYLVAQMALALEKRRPDIIFEVVESRGLWRDALEAVSARTGTMRESLSNVVVTGNTSAMRPIYKRSRVLLSPSLWWESGNRVLVEAMLNGIPTIVTNRGGPPEMIGEGGITITLPKEFHKPPYKRLLNRGALASFTGVIERLYDDEVEYNRLADRALRVAEERHDINRSTDRLIEQLSRFIPSSAREASTP
jgi:glycosyltransferase involved in cell wall biosynthesis